MSYHDAPARGAASADAGSISIPWVILASLVCGVGLWLIAFWLINLTGAASGWIYFLGVPVLIVGAIMFLNPRMGPDHA
jgi:hypothetical protein